MPIQSRAWLARTLGQLGAFAEGRRHGEEALRLAMLEGRGLHRSLPTAASATCTSPKGTWSTPSGCWSKAWPSVVPPANGTGCDGSRQTWALPLCSRGACGGACAAGGGDQGSVRTGALEDHAYLARLSEVCRLAGRGEEAWQHAARRST